MARPDHCTPDGGHRRECAPRAAVTPRGRGVVRVLTVLIALLGAIGASGVEGGRAAAQTGIGISVSMRSGSDIAAPYQLELSAHGGVPPYEWSVIGGALPEGLALSTAGEVMGAPVSADAGGAFVVRVVDAAGQIAEQTITVNARPPALPTFPDETDLDIVTACGDAQASNRAMLQRLCEYYLAPDVESLTRWIVGRMIERMFSVPAMLWP